MVFIVFFLLIGIIYMIRLYKKAKDKKEKPQMNPELEGFEITINEFGQISSTYDLDKIYKFLDKNVPDKKLENKSKGKSQKAKGKRRGNEK